MQLRYCLFSLSLPILLAACSSQGPTQSVIEPPASTPVALTSIDSPPISWALNPQHLKTRTKPVEPGSEEALLDDEAFALPPLEAILQRGMALIGTPYRFGGTSEQTGFDCSGFINYLFEREAGVNLPRTSGDMARMSAPRVERTKLQRGDLLFFARRGRVSHAGIYLGDDEFLHSSSSRSGGVRVDRLSSKYWSDHYLTALRVPVDGAGPQH